MKIVDIETHIMGVERFNWVFVRLNTDTGIYGWGEGSLEGQEPAVAEAVESMSRRIVGEDPTCIEKNWQILWRHGFWRGGAVLTSALSAIDQALWDITGKSLGVPVYKLLGGQLRHRIRAYSNALDAEHAGRLLAQGFTAIKTGGMPSALDPKTGRSPRIDPDKVVAWLEHHVRAIRDTVGCRTALMVDNHGRAWPSLAIRQMEAVAPYNLLFFEDPIPPGNPAAMVRLRQSPVPTDLAGGERLFSRWDFRSLIEDQLVDVIQPDVCHCGGISELRRIAAAAETYFLKVAPHNPNGPVSTAASIQLAAALPNLLILEVSESVLRHTDVLRSGLALRDGHFEIPTAPGLGVDLNLEIVKQHPYKRQDYQGLFYYDGSPADI